MATIAFEYTYASLPERFYQVVRPGAFPRLQVLRWNDALAEELGIDRGKFAAEELAGIFSGVTPPSGAKVVAQAYSGHQFGQFNPHLGDGRALLLGELRDLRGNLRDVHLKGSGQTQFSRAGDGRANLSAVIREYVVSEAMHRLGVPTSRPLAIIATGEEVFRESAQPGAILVRVAASHIRVGTFEHFAARNDREALQRLADFVIDRHFPELSKDQKGYLTLFEQILERQARLVAQWMQLGFIHGVMNTDNTFISGETLDYGPCAFMEDFDLNVVFSSIDHAGRYAYGRQPEIAQWNLGSLAGCFVAFVPGDEGAVTSQLETLLRDFPSRYKNYYHAGMKRKVGGVDFGLVERLLELMSRHHADFTQSFRELSGVLQGDALTSTFWQHQEVAPWVSEWRAEMSRPQVPPVALQLQLNAVNPLYIPRNHLVERVIRTAVDQGEWTSFDQLVRTLEAPYTSQQNCDDLSRPASPSEQVLETFCNT